MKLRFRLAIAGLSLTGMLSACAAMSPAADEPGLDGTAWVLASLPGRTLVPGSTVTLGFDAGRASGTDGCNRYTAPYSASGGTFAIQPSGASTMMACPAEIMQQANAFTTSLAGARSYRVTGGRLHLLGFDGALLADFAPQAQGMAGTSWRVTGYNNGRQAVVGVLADTTLTLSFAADGRVHGSAGCNNFSGSYSASGSSLTIGPAAATRKMCSQPAHIMEQEQQFLKALETVATARQDGDRLELRRADGALAVSLVRQPVR